MRSKYFQGLVLVTLLSTSSCGYAAPRVTAAKDKIAHLVDGAFGAIWLDSDWEDFDIEYAVREALDAGASPNARGDLGETLLTQAVENNRESVVRLLLRRGADVNLPSTHDGDTPLIRASNWALGGTSLLPIARMLLQRRANPDRRNKDGETALTLAATNGYSEVVEILLKAKAKANFRLRDKNGFTPLQLASEPVPRGCMSYMGFPPLPSTKTNNPKQVQKEMRQHEQMLEQQARADERSVAQGRAKARRMLLAAGAKQ